MHAHMYTCVFVRIYAYMYVCTCVCKYAFMHRLKSIMLQNFPIILSGTSFFSHLLFQNYSDTTLIFPKLCLQHAPY